MGQNWAGTGAVEVTSREVVAVSVVGKRVSMATDHYHCNLIKKHLRSGNCLYEEEGERAGNRSDRQGGRQAGRRQRG